MPSIFHFPGNPAKAKRKPPKEHSETSAVCKQQAADITATTPLHVPHRDATQSEGAHLTLEVTGTEELQSRMCSQDFQQIGFEEDGERVAKLLTELEATNEKLQCKELEFE